MGLDIFWGEEWLENIHEAFCELMMMLVLIHVGVAILYSRFSQDNIVKAMITGRKVVKSDRKN